MSFFSVVQLEPHALHSSEHRLEWRRLNTAGAAYRDHCLMWKLFPRPNSEPSQAGFVFRRRDESQPLSATSVARQSLSFYVVSRERPLAVPGLLTVTAKEYTPVLETGELVRFELRANPSTAHRRPAQADATAASRRSVHRDVLTRAKLAAKEAGSTLGPEQALSAASDWLLSRAPRWGLRVLPDQLLTNAYTKHRLHRGSETICFSSLDYAGLAEVTDPVLLRRALLEGVGRKRAFGCGLLLVRRLG